MSFPDPKSNQFYKLTLKEAISFYWYGMINASGLLYFAVKIYRKDGQSFRINNIPEFCEKLGITKRKFYKAKADLISTGFLEEEIYGAIGLKSVRLYDDRSITGDDRSITGDDRSITGDDRSITGDDRSITTTIVKPPNDKGFSNPSDIYSDISSDVSQISLSDLREEPLTVESTKVVGEENMEGERENFSAFSEEENSEEEVVSSKLGVMSKNTQNSKLKTQDSEEQDLNSSSSLSKKEQPQIKPKNQSEENKGFGVCSTNELKKQYDNRGFPRLIQKLYEVGLEESQHNEFIDHAIKKMKKLPKFPTYPDDHAMSRFSALMGAYLNREQEQISEERAMELKAAALWREQMELRKQGKLRGE